MNESSEANPAGDPIGPAPVLGPPPSGPTGSNRPVLGQVVGAISPDLGIIVGAALSGSGIFVSPAQSLGSGTSGAARAAVRPEVRGPSPVSPGPAVEGPTTDSGFVVPGDNPGGFAVLGSFDRAFRREVAAKIREVLVKAYSTQREFVFKEARRRNISVEELLAVYLTRIIMEKVDREYL